MFDPDSLLLQCLNLIEKCEIEPNIRFQIYKNLSNLEIENEIKPFLINFVTQLTYKEILNLILEPEDEHDLLQIYKEFKSIDFTTFEIKFQKSFYGKLGYYADRDEMKIENLDLTNRDWIKEFIKFENGFIELEIPKSGKYSIYQESRSTNRDRWAAVYPNCTGPAMGVNLSFEMELEKVRIR